jgi:hypothetical protein
MVSAAGAAPAAGLAATDRTALTARYLDEVRRYGASADELRGTLPESELLNAFFFGRYLSRPLFIGHAERDRLHADMENLRTALISLPDLLYGGDLAAFARAAGAAEVQVSAILRSRSATVTRQTRGDLYPTESGFRLMEFNMGSALGGMEIADMCRALLAHPVLARFAEAHHLSYVDTMREQVNDMFTECGLAPDSFPVVAVTDWPSSYANKLGRYMHLLARRWRELGLDAHACHVGELTARNGRVWLRGRPVDIVARMFLIEYLLESPDAAALMDPVLDAEARGEVKTFTPFDSELFGSKGALAMVSDVGNRHLFTAAEQASLEAILPWTRMVRPGPVALEDGRTVDLLDYAADHADDLVLKPTMRYGGQDVVVGWYTDPGTWREYLARAAGGPYVIQRRVRPVPELFPDENGDLIPWVTLWGPFTVVSGHGGIFARGVPVDSDTPVVNAFSGASVGCCLSAEPVSG